MTELINFMHICMNSAKCSQRLVLVTETMDNFYILPHVFAFL